jgi:hypothetical protein
VQGQASVGTVDAVDGEGADAVKAAIRKHSTKLKGCYESRLKEDPNLSGRVLLEIDVHLGRVTGAAIMENSTGDSALGSCITKLAWRWRLPHDAMGIFAIPIIFEGG